MPRKHRIDKRRPAVTPEAWEFPFTAGHDRFATLDVGFCCLSARQLLALLSPLLGSERKRPSRHSDGHRGRGAMIFGAGEGDVFQAF